MTREDPSLIWVEVDGRDAKLARSLAAQDTSGDVDDSYGRTGDAIDAIRRWHQSGAEGGDRELIAGIDRIGERAMAAVYEAVRKAAAR